MYLHYNISCDQNMLSTEGHNKFEQYMEQCLKLEAIKIRKKRGENITDKQESDIKYNTDRKSAILKTYVIKSIANLTYFFKFINEHPDLVKNFDKDIEKILGLNMPIDSKKAPFAKMLREFIGEEYFDTVPAFNFRIRLLSIMQFLIRQKAGWMSVKLNDLPTRNDYEMSDMLIHDLKRAEVWLGYIDKFVAKIPYTNKENEGKIQKKPKSNCKTIIPKMEKFFPKKPLS
jgi:hypothetical protein